MGTQEGSKKVDDSLVIRYAGASRQSPLSGAVTTGAEGGPLTPVSVGSASPVIRHIGHFLNPG